MFTCPKCGDHTFRSTTLRDGSVERECRGTIKDVHDRGASRAAMSRPRPCTFLWLATDDHLHGITAEDGSEQPPRELTTIEKEKQRHEQA